MAEGEEGDGSESADVEEVGLEVEVEVEGQGSGGRQGGQAEVQVWQDVHQIQIQERGAGWRYQGQEGPMRERTELGEGTSRDRKVRAGWEGVLGVQVQTMEYEEVLEGTGKGEWKRRQEGGVDVSDTRGGEALLQLQHRDDFGAGWGAERAVQIRTDRAVWLEPWWKGRYRVAAGGQRWWGWHMTWRADRAEGLPVRRELGGELPGGRKATSGVRAHFAKDNFGPSTHYAGAQGAGGGVYIPGGDDAEGGGGHQNGA